MPRRLDRLRGALTLSGNYDQGVMSTSEATPPLRADARRNRDALLNAARQVFAEEGLSAPLDRIAKLADVGRATLYRRFPTREDLIQAIFQDNLDALQAVADEAGDAPDAFFTIFIAAVEQQKDNLGFIELFTRPPEAGGPTPGMKVARTVRVPWVELIREPLQRAQAADLVRADLDAEDMGGILLMTGAVAAAMRNRDDATERRARIIALLLDAIDPERAPRSLDEPRPGA